MSPATTRRSARLHRLGTNPRHRNSANQPADLYAISNSSDDDNDNDEIPAHISPHRVVANANGPSLRPLRPIKRRLEDAALKHNTGPKKLRTSGIEKSPHRSRRHAQAPKDTGLTSPASSRMVPATNKEPPSRSVSRESPSDSYVDPELFRLVNSKMLKRRPDETPPSPSQQLRLEEAEQEQPAPDTSPIGSEDGEDSAYSNSDLDGDIDLAIEPTPWANGDANGEDAIEQDDDQSLSQNESETDANDNKLPDESLASARPIDNNGLITSGVQHGHVDPYEVPDSPDRADHDEGEQGGESMASRGFDGLSAAEQPRGHASTSQAQPVQAQTGVVRSVDGQESEEDKSQDVDIDSDVDFDVESNVDLEYGNISLKECLTQDVERFRSRDGRSEDSLLFEPPEGPSSATIHLSSENFKMLCEIIKKKGWLGARRAKDAEGKSLDWEFKLQDDWERKLHDDDSPVTSVGKVIFHFAEKVERLIQLAFTISSPETRNQFFKEHVDFLAYCFSMIEDCIAFIHDRRLSLSRTQKPLSRNKKKRKKMLEEIAGLHIPTFVRLLKRIWIPCSRNERRTSFDSFTIQLLARVVGWISQLYTPLNRNVQAGGGSASLKKVREEFETPLKQLHKQLRQAPKLLEQEQKLQELQETHRQRQLELQRIERQRQLELQEEKDLETKLEGERKLEARRRQNQEVAQFIRRGYPLRKRGGSQQVSPQSPRAAIGVKETIWRGEEERVLCEKLLSSFAYESVRLPDLNITATLIGHSRDETIDKARELLQTIMARAGMGSLSEEEIQNRVQAIIRQWE